MGTERNPYFCRNRTEIWDFLIRPVFDNGNFGIHHFEIRIQNAEKPQILLRIRQKIGLFRFPFKRSYKGNGIIA